MLYFTSLERIRNGLNDLFVFKEPEKEVKRGLHDASLNNVDFYKPGKKLEMDSDLLYKILMRVTKCHNKRSMTFSIL